MNLLKNDRVQEYISSLGGMNPSQKKLSICKCLQKNSLVNAHTQDAKQFSNNLAKVAVTQGNDTIKSVVIYITVTSYFGGNTMQYLIENMLNAEDITNVQVYYNILDSNFDLHPPCAKYMSEEYEKLLLVPHTNYFQDMALWDYLIDRLRCLIDGTYLYGENVVFDFSFKMLFCFCIDILNVDFEVSKKNNSDALIMKCLKYNPKRKTRMYDITTLLDKLFNTGFNFQMPVINLALLINELR